MHKMNFLTIFSSNFLPERLLIESKHNFIIFKKKYVKVPIVISLCAPATTVKNQPCFGDYW